MLQQKMVVGYLVQNSLLFHFQLGISYPNRFYFAESQITYLIRTMFFLIFEIFPKDISDTEEEARKNVFFP